MADKTAGPKRWVLIRMLHAAVERTEAEIAELKSHRLFVRDATGPDDHHEDPPDPAAETSPPAGDGTDGTGTTTPPSAPAGGAGGTSKPDTRSSS